LTVFIARAGWRTGRNTKVSGNFLYRRLNEHARSIELASDLETKDFKCRLIILGKKEADLIIPVEAELIRRISPKWNSSIDGFGNHDPGAGRYNQAKSEWDVLHPGRKWAEKCAGIAPKIEDMRARRRFLPFIEYGLSTSAQGVYPSSFFHVESGR
jgi:hypothetical protein